MQLGLVTSTQSTRCALPCVAQETSHTTKASLLCKPTAWPKAVWSTHKQSAIRNRRNLVKECSPTRAILQVDRPVNLDQPSEGLKQESTNAQDDQKYSWTKQWYPVAIAEDLETYKPNALTLLGKNLVIWMDKDSQWRCFDDVCPHRLVPLSEGRLETDGTLQCAYHGWRFDAEGTCTTIPQADSEQLQKAAGHPRACVPSYPVQVQHHLMWVWADASPNAQLECLSKQPAVVEELQQDDNVIYLHPWFMREMPFGHDILLENILDPSHVPFSHHGVIGDRNKVEPSTMHQLAPVDRHSGFQLGIEVHKNGTNRAQAGTGKMTKIKFEPPSLVKYSFGGPGMQMITYAAPMSPGRSRVFYCLVADKAKAPKGMKRVMALRPSWLKFANHFQRNEVLDGDNVFLHGQDTYLHSGADKKGYYMPTTMDKGIVSLRRWLGTLAGPIPWAGAGPADVWGKQPSRHEMLDRFNQHTKHCKNCSKARCYFQFVVTGSHSMVIMPLVILELVGKKPSVAGAEGHHTATESCCCSNGCCSTWRRRCCWRRPNIKACLGRCCFQRHSRSNGCMEAWSNSPEVYFHGLCAGRSLSTYMLWMFVGSSVSVGSGSAADI